MGEELLRFIFRKDMPEGFKSSDIFPELPAMLNFLKPHEGKEFSTPEQFQTEVLDGFIGYLQENNVPVGEDKGLRSGLHVEPAYGEYIYFNSCVEYVVFTHVNAGPGQCLIGGLERITQ